MMKIYKKPVISIDNEISEGVYAASGASKGTLDVTYHGVWDRLLWQTGPILMVRSLWLSISMIKLTRLKQLMHL
mgnify:CR=1 FL=1